MLHTHRDGRLVSRRSEPYSWHKVRTGPLHTSSRECRPAPSRRPKGAPRRASSAERVAQHTRHTAFEWRLTNVFLLLSASISARRFFVFRVPILFLPRLSRESFRATAFCRKFFSCLKFFFGRGGHTARSLAICSRSRRRVAACTHATPPLRPHHPLRSHGISVCMRRTRSPALAAALATAGSETLLCGRHRTHCLALQESTPAPPDPHPLALAHASCCRC